MENSLSSSNSEPTISGAKCIFKKPTDFYQAFEVSLEESITTAQNSKSEPDLEVSSGSPKPLPFKASRKPLQQSFSVSLNDSAVNNESEQSVTFKKTRSIFKKKNKSLVDFFNVSFNETNASLQADTLGKTLDESNTDYMKKNPFKNKDVVGKEISMHVSLDENNKSILEPQRQSPPIDGDEADSTTFPTKENPFKKPNRQENSSSSHLQLSVTNENQSVESNTADTVNENTITNTSGVNNDSDSCVAKSKLNPFEHKKSLQNCDSVISITEERSNRSLENAVLSDPKRMSKNMSLERSILKVTNGSASYLEQSSINDENLNNWMSDHSDEEMPSPRIPSVTANLSHTKEKPAVPSSPVADETPLSIWEQKFNEIISYVEKKCLAAKSNLDLGHSSKPKDLKKSVLNLAKPSEGKNKYKPPKLIRPASFATKKLYEYIIKRLEPKYGIDTMIESENLVLSICDTVKKVTRRKSHQKRLIQNLKKEMAKAGLIETTMDFYEFVIKFLPYSFRVKVVPCLQPVTNVVYPPKDVANPFDKIL